jgi:hypothetical protein
MKNFPTKMVTDYDALIEELKVQPGNYNCDFQGTRPVYVKASNCGYGLKVRANVVNGASEGLGYWLELVPKADKPKKRKAKPKRKTTATQDKP